MFFGGGEVAFRVIIVVKPSTLRVLGLVEVLGFKHGACGRECGASLHSVHFM